MEYNIIRYEDINDISSLQPEGWPDITHAFQFYCKQSFCNPIKIIIDGSVAGIGNAIIFDHTAWLAHIIVDKDKRNRGIGFKIVDFLLEDLKKRGVDSTLLVATELGEPVYIKAGFQKVSDYCYFKRELSLTNQKDITNVEPYRSDFYNEVVRLDSYISGEKREKLLKCFLDKSFVYIHNNQIDGFYIPGLGEGPVFALTNNAGRTLIKFKMATSFVEKVTIPGENQAGIEILKECGFVETNTTGKRMVLGNDIPWKPEMIYSRVGGNLG